MSGHTPGPWEIKKDDDSWRIRQKGSVKHRFGFTVERPVGEGFHEKYDAILAAAAPDLLEALEHVEVMLTGDSSEDIDYRKVVRAIARAKG